MQKLKIYRQDIRTNKKTCLAIISVKNGELFIQSKDRLLGSELKKSIEVRSNSGYIKKWQSLRENINGKKRHVRYSSVLKINDPEFLTGLRYDEYFWNSKTFEGPSIDYFASEIIDEGDSFVEKINTFFTNLIN